MKRIVLAVLAGVAVWGLSACERSERPGVFEPAFGKTTLPPNPCPAIIGETDPLSTTKYEIVVGLYDGIDALFQDVRSRNGAKSHVDNIVREVCEGDYPAAQNFLQILIQQIQNQPDDFLLPYQPHGTELEAWARVLAREMAVGFALPEGVLNPDAVLAITEGGSGAPAVQTRNGAVIVNASDFRDGLDVLPFVIAIAPGSGNFADYGYVVYPNESYQIATDHPDGLGLPGYTVDIIFCAPEGTSFPGSLKVAHEQVGVEVELLETFNASTYCNSLAYSTDVLNGAPKWLRSLAHSAGSVVRNVFGPAPLHARAITGLGGRANSFSPFALVR